MLASIIVANYIVQQLKLPLVGEILCPNFFPLAVVKNNMIGTGARIYGNKKVIVVVSEYQIKDAEVQNDVVQALLEFASRNKCSVVISIDAITEDPTESKKLFHNLAIQAVGNGEEGEEGDEEMYGDGGDDEEEDEDIAPPTGNRLKLSALQVPHTTVQTLPNSLTPSSAKHTNPDKKDDKKALKEDKKDKESKEKKKTKEAEEKKKKKSKSGTDKKKKDKEEEDKKEEEEKKKKLSVWYLTNDEKQATILHNLGYFSVVDLAVSGVPAGLITEAPVKNIACVILFVKLDEMQIGTRSAIELLKCIDTMLFHPDDPKEQKILDLTEISKSTEELEKELKDIIDKLQQQDPSSTAPPHSMYL
jgi:predicted ATP-grasp superfamily ATP-dependent carboligase